MLGGVLIVPLAAAGRSPHTLYRPSEIPVTFDDVVGLGIVRDEVIKTLNLFLAYKTFRDTMGGTPRRAILFEGPPGTGKTYMAKAMAREAAVPFLFVSASAFQSMYYGQTNRKIRSYFKELRKTARREGGAIGFIEEIDAIAGARSGMSRATPTDGGIGPRASRARPGRASAASSTSCSCRCSRSTSRRSAAGSAAGGSTGSTASCPPDHQIQKQPPTGSNILVIGATNRAADLDPALLRPGRFDRSIYFGLPGRGGRREIIDYYLNKKAHVPELDKDERRDQLAAMTFQYSPVMIEHLFDEALVWCLRDGRDAMDWADVQQAKLTEEIGLAQPVEYTVEEKSFIATHEAGHAVVAYLVGVGRKLEVLSIIKRRDALGSARALGHRGALHAHPLRADREHPDQLRWHDRRGAVLRRVRHRARWRPHGRDDAGRADGRLVRHGRHAARASTRSRPDRINQGIVAKVLGDDEARRSVERILEQAKADVRNLLDTHRHLVVALRDALLETEELVGDEILEVLQHAEAELDAGADAST